MKFEPVDPDDFNGDSEMAEIAQKIQEVDDCSGLEVFCNMISEFATWLLQFQSWFSDSDTDEEPSPPPQSTNEEVKKEEVEQPVAEPAVPAAAEDDEVVITKTKQAMINGLKDFDEEVVVLLCNFTKQLQHTFDMKRVKKEPVEPVPPVLQPEVAVVKLEQELSSQNPPEAPRSHRRHSRSSRYSRDHRQDNRRYPRREGPRDPGFSKFLLLLLPIELSSLFPVNGARFCLPHNDLAAEQREFPYHPYLFPLHSTLTGRRDDRRAAAEERERRRDDRRREDRRREDRRREDRRRAERRREERRGEQSEGEGENTMIKGALSGHNDRARKRNGDRPDDEWPRRGGEKRRRY